MPGGAQGPLPASVRAKIGTANSRHWQAKRAALAERLRELGDLTNVEAAALLGCNESTCRSVRKQFGLSWPGRRPPTAKHRERIAASVRKARARVEDAPVPEPTVPPLVRRAGSPRPTAAKVAEVQRRIDAGERVARWTCGSCGASVRWPSRPPGWWGHPPAVALKCPCCRPEAQLEKGR